jgi:hypothetical protein
MSRWSDAFHALTPPLTHATHVDTCIDAGSDAGLPDQAYVSSSVPCVAAADRADGASHGQGTKRDGNHVSSSVPCVGPGEGIGGASSDTRPRRRLTDQQACAAAVAGLQAAALQRPPSCAGGTALPSIGTWCSCCRGQRWWSEARDPTGWRCRQCHPPTHVPADAVREVQT